ncbi:DDB1- and CUL4-associated factor 17-like [Biomphalaria glabrata]|uniref:DDB1- and CUL4-associated factor 17-like n=1 Tax=Biomphalaria glabrata TaxID=6526 RepID=A0A9U8EFP4_BIOGL|nr:DDB1- and CUL4-associated factor 17-like [Biomphalaria glabrata]KAI8736412.1 DDB1- and CUL4-associated factor 17 isoform X1 [Biomphalaria glabrata]
MPLLRIYKTSSLDKRCNIYCHLIAKEYCTKSSHRRIHYILGTLIIRCDYTFAQIWHKESKKHIACDGKFAFFDNYEKCISCIHPGNSPLFVIQKPRPGKIEDGLIMEGLPETVDLPHQGYKGCLFAINSDNFLFRVDLESGQVLEEVYLGDSSVKFRRLQWNTIDESFIVCSTKKCQQINGRAPESGDIMQLVVLSCMPLEFICKFSITKKIFGKSTCDATIFLNILVVMHTSSYVCMYSLERIIKQSLTHQQKLYTKLQDGSSYGLYPSALTQNIEISETPECLFQVRCQQHDVMLTMPPCYYVMCPYGKNRGYECWSFKTHQKVVGGYIKPEEDEQNDRISLHADDSGRILHMKNEELRVLKLVEMSDGKERQLVDDFVIKCHEQSKHQAPIVSQSGRIIKQRQREGCIDLPERLVHTMGYSDDLDMIFLLSSAQPLSDSQAQQTYVGFYDNWNGKLLRQFVLERRAFETLERSLFYQLDTISHVIKTMDRKFECSVFKLQAVPDLTDECCTNKKEQQSPRRRVQSHR